MEEASGEGARHHIGGFTVDDVGWFLELADRAGVACWLVGGWGVDALLGEQTRPHSDLDIVVLRSEHESLRDALVAEGFHTLLDADHRPWNYVMLDDARRRVDFHVIRFDEAGRGLYELTFTYPPGSLDGHGVIEGTPVRVSSHSPADRPGRRTMQSQLLGWPDHPSQGETLHLGLAATTRSRV